MRHLPPFLTLVARTLRAEQLQDHHRDVAYCALDDSDRVCKRQ